MKIEWNKLTARRRDVMVSQLVTVWSRIESKAGGYHTACYGITDSLHGRRCGGFRSVEACLDYLESMTPNYTTDIAAAFQVVDKMKFNWTLTCNNGDCAGTRTEGIGYRMIYMANGMPMESVLGDTAPEAICIAALMAQGHEVIQ